MFEALQKVGLGPMVEPPKQLARYGQARQLAGPVDASSLYSDSEHAAHSPLARNASPGRQALAVTVVLRSRDWPLEEWKSETSGRVESKRSMAPILMATLVSG